MEGFWAERNPTDVWLGKGGEEADLEEGRSGDDRQGKKEGDWDAVGMSVAMERRESSLDGKWDRDGKNSGVGKW